MPRKPTATDRKVLRRLYGAAGSMDELKRWVDDALSEKPRRGRKNLDTESQLVALEIFCRALEQQPRVTRTDALRTLMQDMKIPGYQNADYQRSVIARLNRKLRDPKFQRKIRVQVQVRHYPRRAVRTDLNRARIKSESA